MAASALNFNLQIADGGALTARTTVVSTFLCPSSTGGGPASFNYPQPAPNLPADLAPSQYVASAGEFQLGLAASKVSGVFASNSGTGIVGISDGSSTTLMIGERSRNLADATSVGAILMGVIPEARFCSNKTWPVQICGGSGGMVLAHTNSDPSQPASFSGFQLARGRRGVFVESSPRRLQLPVLRWLGAVPQVDHPAHGLQRAGHAGRWRGRRG